jgi:hypothetical protein
LRLGRAEGIAIASAPSRSSVTAPEMEAARLDLGLFAGDPPGLLHKEDPRDLGHGQPSDHAQGQRHSGLHRERRMTAAEYQPEPLIVDGAREDAGRYLDGPGARLDEGAEIVVIPVTTYVLTDPLAQRAPRLQWAVESELLGTLNHSVDSDPGYHSGRVELSWRTARFPHALIRSLPDRCRSVRAWSLDSHSTRALPTLTTGESELRSTGNGCRTALS